MFATVVGFHCKSHASKGVIELAVLKAFLRVLLEVLAFGLLLAVKLSFGILLVHALVYGTHKQAHNQTQLTSRAKKEERQRTNERRGKGGCFRDYFEWHEGIVIRKLRVKSGVDPD